MDFILQYFHLTLSLGALISLGVAAISAVVLLLGLHHRLRAISAKVNHDDEELIPVDGYPSVSVIVFSQGDGEGLRTLIRQIFEQDYPAPLEVVVVNDQKADETADVVSELELQYPNLYMTFAPERSRNLSRKKLSVTLGMKAARHEIAVLTLGNCRIESPLWLRLMMRHIIEGKDVVLGFSLLGTEDAEGSAQAARLARSGMFDYQWDSVRWLGSALNQHPYRGDGCNLAYRRSLFFENKGFSRSLNYNYGDDDIFISEIATPENTGLELSPDSRVVAVEQRPDYMFGVLQKRRHFTAGKLPRKSYRMMGLYSASMLLLWASAIGCAVFSLPTFTGTLLAVIVLAGVLTPLMRAWRRSGISLGMPRQALLTQPFLMLTHPLRSWALRRRANKVKSEQYTWGQKL